MVDENEDLDDLFDDDEEEVVIEEQSEVVDSTGDSFDPDNTPNPESQSEGGEVAKEVLKEEYEEEHTEPQGDAGAAAKEVKLQEEVPELPTAELIVGKTQASALLKIAESNNRKYSDIVELKELPEIGHIEVSDNKLGAPAFVTFYDNSGNDITDSISTIMDLPADFMSTIKGDSNAILFDNIIENSAFTGPDAQSARPFNSDLMGNCFKETFATFTNTADQLKRRSLMSETLKNLRSLMMQLSKVFAFDDYRHLEAFMAAWMMQDSTCRLSGVPGTGKTTVIECAATLLSNSYGFNVASRICAGGGYRAKTLADIFADNDDFSNIYDTLQFPSGQKYHISYGNMARKDIKNRWEEWRFSDWHQPSTRDGKFAYAGITDGGDNAVRASGAYLYDFSFLQSEYSTANQSQQYNKLPLKSDAFRNMLLNHYYVDVPLSYDVGDKETYGLKVDEEHIPVLSGRQATKRLVKPIKIFNADGSAATIKPFLELPNGHDAEGNPSSIRMYLAHPEYLRVYQQTFELIENTGRSVADAVKELLSETDIDGDRNGLYTDAGRNEGYWFREFLLRNFYDDRAAPKESGTQNLDSISLEMITEIGIAKVDYEKRADEVLYGMEIRETSSYDAAVGGNVNTFDFEPIPRPIVTQPIKFFNEANRSKPGMEDAILGLIAERKVEYRGKEFDSPNFVAWMDTNPHQKGNDLAFTDRIDMELLFKSVGMGGRYNILAGKSDLPPKLSLVNELRDKNALQPLRFNDLRNMWNFIKKDINLVQPGGAYDGFRDISAISVLFSQSYRKRMTSTGVNRQNAAWLENPHESPLVDFSTTTNTESGGAGEGTKSPVIENPYSLSGWAGGDNKITGDVLGTQANSVHVPAAFKRILGFRFTNSLMKLSRAFAFLRGKLYVSREDIVDALPYVTAHRMGRSREGLSDIEGNTKGIDKSIAKKLAYNNEQEFIREVLVNGYINRDIDVGQGRGASLLEMLDTFYERCVSILQSCSAAWEYEEQVLQAMQSYINSTTQLSTMLSPVHWHIATMVSENERKGYSTLRDYNFPNDNATGYPEMYNYFLQRITQPVSNPGSEGDAGLIDYYFLRGEVANNVNLFSDDKARLLRLIDEEIGVVAAGSTGNGNAFPESSAVDVSRYGSIGKKMITEVDKFYTRSYGDPLGAWGAVSGMSSQYGEISSNSDQIWGNLNMNSPNFYAPASVPADNNMVSRLSNQQLKVIGRFTVGEEYATSAEYGRFMKSINGFMAIAQGWAGRGRIILDSAQQDSYKDFEKGAVVDYPTEAIGFSDFMGQLKGIVKAAVKDPAQPADYTIIDRTNKKVQRKATMSGQKGAQGIMACFELPHSPISKFKPERLKSEETDETVFVTGGRGKLNDVKRSMKSGDHLRLWIKLASIGSVESTGYHTLMFSVGITSNFGIYMNPLGGVGQSSENETIEWCAIDFEPAYLNKFWATGSSQQLYTDQGSKATLIDAGNMTKADKAYYAEHIGRALMRD